MAEPSAAAAYIGSIDLESIDLRVSVVILHRIQNQTRAAPERVRFSMPADWAHRISSTPLQGKGPHSGDDGVSGGAG